MALRRTRRPYHHIEEELANEPGVGPGDDPHLTGVENRLLLASLAERFDARDAPIVLPQRIRDLYPRQRRRILEGLSLRDGLDFYRYENESFLKELAIAAHRLVPHGRGFADPWGRVSGRLLTAGGPKQLARALRLFAFETRGLGPFLTLHLHSLDLPDRDDPGGWADTHRTIASILELNPEIRGEAGGGWLYDPQVERISPRQAFRRRVVVEGGAIPLFLRRDVEGTSGAISTSATRRGLFERGEYVPEIWICVWPRRALLQWAAAGRGD
jgi:hypothetical protein